MDNEKLCKGAIRATNVIVHKGQDNQTVGAENDKQDREMFVLDCPYCSEVRDRVITIKYTCMKCKKVFLADFRFDRVRAED